MWYIFHVSSQLLLYQGKLYNSRSRISRDVRINMLHLDESRFVTSCWTSMCTMSTSQELPFLVQTVESHGFSAIRYLSCDIIFGLYNSWRTQHTAHTYGHELIWGPLGTRGLSPPSREDKEKGRWSVKWNTGRRWIGLDWSIGLQLGHLLLVTPGAPSIHLQPLKTRIRRYWSLPLKCSM